MRTQIAIIGGGPAGLLLSEILYLNGIESIVMERQTRQYVLSRIRAGVLEWGTVEILRDAGLGDRMDREGHVHDGTAITWGGDRRLFLDIKKHVDSQFMAYGQTKIQEDLDNALQARDGAIFEEAVDVMPHGFDTDSPWVTFVKDGEEHRIDCDFIAGCDGFHGVSRTVIPDDVLREYQREYPFGWLGILSETPPLPELTYCNSPRGFALSSMRTPMLSRYYIQVPLDTDIEAWPDDRFWEELKARYPNEIAEQIVTGPSIEKSIAPLRSFVAEPMRYGRLFLAGDSAHIVPPTGAKGLNLAVSDVYYLSRALVDYYDNGSSELLDTYSDTALHRVWSAVRFSWWLTTLLHRFPDMGDFGQRIQESELDYLASSDAFQAAVAEQYAGLPL
ncbi:MAG: 4-hydroxybenzoate 3-monooxygenase [Acidobacteria bacterium]|nr:4-hydroxybenzoate 3-monooxygenase [Acidobacteriota bacterium]